MKFQWCVTDVGEVNGTRINSRAPVVTPSLPSVRQPGRHADPMRLLFNGTPLGVTNGTYVEPSRTLLRNRADLGYGFRWTPTPTWP